MLSWAYLGYGTVSKSYSASVSAMLLTTEAADIDIKEENPAGTRAQGNWPKELHGELGEKTCPFVLYIYTLALDMKKIWKNISADKLEQSLLVFKNVTEKTRFEIAKFLLNGEHFGQEIAEKLQISTAVVFYQMNYLFAANLVKIKKVACKVYYVLNKDTIRKDIEFLEMELEL